MMEDDLTYWITESTDMDARVEEIEHFDARGMCRVYNRVPVNKVNAYLKRNPVMAKAWEDAGWQLDKP